MSESSVIGNKPNYQQQLRAIILDYRRGVINTATALQKLAVFG